MLLSIIVKVFLGVLVGGFLGWIITGDWIYTIVWAVAVPVVIMLGVFGGSRVRRTPGTSGIAPARVESVQRVGSNVDGSQLVDVRLTVADDITYTTTSRASFTDDDLRTIRPGTIVAVQRAGANRPDARIITDPIDSIEAELAKARQDPSLIPPASSVPAWETATTTTPGGPKPGSRGARGGSKVGSRILSLGIIAAVAAGVLFPAWQSIGRGVNNILTGNWGGSNMITGLYQQESVDQMIEAAGTSQFTSINFYPTYLLGDAISRTSDEHTDSISWRYGRAWVDGPSFIQDSDLDSKLFDASALDWSMVAKSANAAIELSGIEHPESVYAGVRVDTGTRVPAISISVSDAYDDAYVTYSFDGEVLSKYGSVFDE